MPPPLWGDEDSLGNRVARHRAPWSAAQRAMIERETRAAADWAATLDAPELHGYDIKAGGPLYEPSSPAPRHDRWLVAALAVAGCFLFGLMVFRRVREPWGMAAFALIIAATVIVAKWGLPWR